MVGLVGPLAQWVCIGAAVDESGVLCNRTGHLNSYFWERSCSLCRDIPQYAFIHSEHSESSCTFCSRKLFKHTLISLTLHTQPFSDGCILSPKLQVLIVSLMLAVLSTTDTTNLEHIKKTMSGMIGISTSIGTSTERDEFLALWSSQTASDAKFDSIRAAGGALQSTDFASDPATLEVYFAYVSGCIIFVHLGQPASQPVSQSVG